MNSRTESILLAILSGAVVVLGIAAYIFQCLAWGCELTVPPIPWP